MPKRVEIRRPDPQHPNAIDEIVAKGCMVHIEQLSENAWSIYIEAEEANYWFHLGAKNARVAVNLVIVDIESKAKRAHRR